MTGQFCTLAAKASAWICPLTRQQAKTPINLEKTQTERQQGAVPERCPLATPGDGGTFHQRKRPALSLAQETTIFIALFGASIADHLQARNAEIAILFFLGGILNFSFLLFLFCLSLRFSAGRPGHRYLVAKVVFQLNRAAT
jgi:hypothetical protein